MVTDVANEADNTALLSSEKEERIRKSRVGKNKTRIMHKRKVVVGGNTLTHSLKKKKKL